MTYALAIAAIKTTVGTVPGIKRVVNGFPLAAQNLPLCYLEASSGARNNVGQLVSNHYQVLAVVCVIWQDSMFAEDQIAPFINTLPAAIDANPTLGGAVSLVQVISWRTDVRAIADVQVRAVEFTIDVLDKKPYHTPGF